MRTNEERAGLIHKRTTEIKRERQRRKQRALDMICMAACLILVVGIGSFMPGLTAGIPGGEVHHASGAAGLVGSHAAGQVEADVVMDLNEQGQEQLRL